MINIRNIKNTGIQCLLTLSRVKKAESTESAKTDIRQDSRKHDKFSSFINAKGLHCRRSVNSIFFPSGRGRDFFSFPKTLMMLQSRGWHVHNVEKWQSPCFVSMLRFYHKICNL